ncbi:MAG: hypothetical protein GY792_05550 [Gammaproteobacteria bacterium]|nr:hypothetical protein [Gammaproteobacteria bacterium]
MIEKSESNQLSLATAPILGQAPSKTEKLLITNKVITSFSISLCTPISYLSFSRSTAVSRVIVCHWQNSGNRTKTWCTNIRTEVVDNFLILARYLTIHRNC